MPSKKLPQNFICQQWLHQHVWSIIINSEDEMQRSCWSRQHSTNIPQITWFFSSPGTTFHIQHIIPPTRFSTNFESHHDNPIAKSLEITQRFFSNNQLNFFCHEVLEPIIANRLYYITESNNLFSSSQAGFGKGRSCEDQILLIAQAIDVFQQWPMHALFWHYWTSVRRMTLFGIRNSSSAW